MVCSQVASIVSLLALFFQNTTLVICLKLTFRDGAVSYNPASVVFLTEITKLAICSCVVAVGYRINPLAVVAQIAHQGHLFLPSVLYVIQNNLLFFGAKRLPSLLYILCCQLKILTTAIMSNLILGTKLSTKQYLYLFLLVFGIVVVQGQGDLKGLDEVPVTGTLFGLLAVVLASLTSGTAGVLLEKIFKTASPSSTTTVHTVWTRNVQLSCISIPFALFVGYSQDFKGMANGAFFEGYDAIVWCVVILQAAGGIIIAYVMRYAGNILKCLAIAMSICCCAVYSVLSGELEPTANLVAGVSFVCISIAGYSSCSTSDALQDTKRRPTSTL